MSMCCWVISPFCNFCILDVSFAVNLCLKRVFLKQLYLLFYYISVAGTWYGVRDTHNFLGAPVAQPAPSKFGTKVVIVTYSQTKVVYQILSC